MTKLTKKLRMLALAAGAKTDTDFALFVHVVEGRKQIAKLIRNWKGTVPSPRGMLWRYEFFLERGQFFQAQPLPKGFRRGKAKHCYGNSFDLTLKKEGLTYCEGFVVIPLSKDKWAEIEHAWCITEDATVIDVTLREPGLAYFGVAHTPKDFEIGHYALPIIDEIIEFRFDAEMKKRRSRARTAKK